MTWPAFDTNIFLAFQSLSNPFFDSIFTNMTFLGLPFLWFIISFWLWARGDTKKSLILFIGLTFDILIGLILKTAINRPRPYEVLGLEGVIPSYGQSFPSTHTSTAFVSATILGKFFHSARWIFYTIAILVGLSRIYYGVHYPLDVIGGLIQGILIGIFVVDHLPNLLMKFKKRK